MKYEDFKNIMSHQRLNRYLLSTNQDKRKSMTLYRKNLRLSQEMFTIISCFEVALRNMIDKHYTHLYGDEWLKNFVITGGKFDNNQCKTTRNIILSAKNKLKSSYNHSKLVAELDFGLWRYLFAKPQFKAAGQNLLQIFPSKPISTSIVQYNQSYVFDNLADINKLRNRIAHHEPICFQIGTAIIDTTYLRQNYNLILQFFKWMDINTSDLLYGLDHILKICREIDDFKN